MKRILSTVSCLVLLLAAAIATAQNADKNSAGPTKNDYRLRVVQPLEGARVTGSMVQVVVDRSIPAERDSKVDVNSMPRPLIDVFLDEVYQGSMRSDENVYDLERVSYGPHTVTILAKNMSGEVIDRKVVAIVNVPLPANRVEERSGTVQPAPPAQAPAPAPAVQAPAPAEPPAAPAQQMPKTGTSDPLLVAAGLGLLLAGIAIRRSS